MSRQGLIDRDIHCDGDTNIDDQHTVEDVGITLGQAFAAAVGNKAGLRRYGHSYVPLDEALSRVVVDFSVRPGLYYHIPFTRSHIGRFDVDLAREFFLGFVNHALVSSDDHTSELQSLMRISYAVFCFKKKRSLIRFITTHR